MERKKRYPVELTRSGGARCHLRALSLVGRTFPEDCAAWSAEALFFINSSEAIRRSDTSFQFSVRSSESGDAVNHMSVRSELRFSAIS